MPKSENYSKKKKKIRKLNERIKSTEQDLKKLKKFNIRLTDSVSLKQIVTITIANNLLMVEEGIIDG